MRAGVAGVWRVGLRVGLRIGVRVGERRAVQVGARLTGLIAALLAALAVAPSHAFKIDPWSYRPPGISPQRLEAQVETFIRNPRMLVLGPIAFGTRIPAAMGQLKEAVHENLTDLSIRCALSPLARTGTGTGAQDMISRCAGRDGALHGSAYDLSGEQQEIIRAVRFNDAPPVKLANALMTFITPSALLCGEVRVPENAGCWAMIMAHAGGLAAVDPGNAQFSKSGNFLYRTHFGDMQFMHAMAARGETLLRTQERVLLWLRFTYQVAVGEIDTGVRIDSLAPEFARDILTGFEDWTVAQFFEIRSGTTSERIRRIALGALLHTLQDSFAHGHAEREVTAPGNEARFGAISAFLNYGCQSEEKHGEADRAAHYKWFADAAHGESSPVTLGAQVIDLVLNRKTLWNGSISGNNPAGPSVGQWARETLFPVSASNAARVAGAGAAFLRTRAPAASSLAPDGPATAPQADDCKE